MFSMKLITRVNVIGFANSYGHVSKSKNVNQLINYPT